MHELQIKNQTINVEVVPLLNNAIKTESFSPIKSINAQFSIFSQIIDLANVNIMRTKIFLLGFAVFFFTSLQSQICTKTQLPTNLQNGLIAYYPFCGNANDASGNVYNGTVTGGAVPFVNDRFGNASSAVQLGGGYIVTNTGAFNFQQNQTFTVSIWFTLETNSSGGRLLSTECPEGNFRIATYGNGNYGVQYGDYIDDNVSLNTWTHLVYTYDNRSEKVYINGVLKYSKTEATNLTFTHCPLTIGAKASASFDRWTGKADDLMVYNRALTACEVSQMYNTTSGNIPQLETPAFNALNDTIKVCGPSATLDAGNGFSSYNWNTAATTQSITATSSGWYKITVTNASGCAASDSTYLSLVKAKIIQRDTTICKGASIVLNLDSTASGASICDASQLSASTLNGLVAYYPFCGNANNALGTGNNGTVFNAVLTTDRFGNSNSAYSFNGTNAYIDFGPNPAIGPTTTIPITISVWVSGGATGNVISKYTNLDASKSYFLFGRSANGYSWIGNGVNPYIQNSGVSDNEWTHYVLVGEAGTNNSKVYRNGTLITSGTLNMNTSMQAVSMLVGKVGASFPGFLNGKVDDILIYNRALTPVDVQSLYLNKPVTTWSTGATSNSINVTPTQTTKYYLTVSDGITSCQDSITVTVNDLNNTNPLQDTIRVCDSLVTLDAGSGYTSYKWSNGASSQTIKPAVSGFYKVTYTNAAGCSGSDSTYLSGVKAVINENDTTICRGASLTLSVDTLSSFIKSRFKYLGSAQSRSFYIGYGNNYWTTARDSSYLLGGRLAILNTIQKDTLVSNQLKRLATASIFPLLPTKPSAWIGLIQNKLSPTYSEPGGGWEWISGDAFSYQNWYPGEPNNNSIGSEFGETNWNNTARWDDRNTNPLPSNLINYIFETQEQRPLQITWSTNQTGDKITVNPTQTTKYFVTVSDGINSCTDSILVNVNDLTGFNPLQDTIRVCGDTLVTLDAGSGYASYKWNTGATTQTIKPVASGFYKVTFTNAAGCSGSDSTYLSSVKAVINENDTTICKGASLTLSVDTLSSLIRSRFKYLGTAQSRSFYLSLNDYSWTSAKDSSYIFGGRLGVLNTIQKDTLVSNLLKRLSLANVFPLSSKNGSAWIGLFQNKQSPSYSEPAGGWVWITGESISYQNWDPGEPNNNQIQSEYGHTNDRTTGRWDDRDTFILQNYIFEAAEMRPLQIKWSTGDTTASINVTPTQTTKYYVTVSDGITTCQDSVTVTVSDIGTFNSLQDTARVCGDSVLLDAGSGYATYNWSNGVTTQKITAKSGGKYKVIVANASGCTASDSSLVSIIKAKILQRDTTICKGASITLAVDSSFAGSVTACNASQLSSSLRNGLVGYWPFCGNANDYSGYGNNGVIFGAPELTSDRFGNILSAYKFSQKSDYIKASNFDLINGNQARTYSFWAKIPESGEGGFCLSYGPELFLANSGCNIGNHIDLNQGSTADCSVVGMGFGINCNQIRRPKQINDGKWHHIVVSYDGIDGFNSLKFYVDGSIVLSNACTQGSAGSFQTQSNGYGLTFGRRVDADNYSGSMVSFKGDLDDIVIWNRSLSSTEIGQLFGDQLSSTWSTGDTTASINVTPTQTTKYYVTVSDGISSCMDSVTVTVAQLDTAITALDPTSVCSTGGTVRLQAGVASAYQWLKDGATISGANAQLFSATQTGSYRVVVTNAAGCSDTSRAIAIVLDPKPVPNFTINNNAQCLTENAFNFTNTSTISAGTLTYSWTLGDATTATSTDASRTYTSAGTYNIKLVATSNRQCTDSITKTITVFDQPAIPTITGPDEFCSGATITLNTNAPATRQWYRNNALIVGATGASYTLQQPGDYKVSTQNSNGCVSFSNTKTITENPLPQGEITTPVSLFICEGTPYTLSATGGSSYQWFRNNVAIAGETSATLVTGLPGNYKAEIVSDKGCRAMGINNFDLTLIKAPDASFSYDTYCVNVQTNFSSRSTTNQSGTVTYAWKFGDGKSAGNTTNTFNTYLNAGNYTATLIVTPTACPQLADSANAVLAIQAPTPGIQYPPVNVIINKDQQLSARNIGIGYLWTPGTFLNSITSRTPTVNANKEQLYRIIISNLAGCTTIDTQLVRVFPDKNIYVPEGFTPDNDGRNDRLYPIPVGIREMKVFRIYNRWGLLVYDNKNANANTGWDGTYKGTRQPMETFAWVAEGIDIDGVLIRRTGNTILIR
jgi:gliding motility-associated-like protein